MKMHKRNSHSFISIQP